MAKVNDLSFLFLACFDMYTTWHVHMGLDSVYLHGKQIKRAVNLSHLLTRAKMNTAFTYMLTCTCVGNLSQNDSKIAIGLHCHNVGLGHFCDGVVGKDCKICWPVGVCQLLWIPCHISSALTSCILLMDSDSKHQWLWFLSFLWGYMEVPGC